jgi:pilus assembly protein Flp/PilA
VTRHRAAMSKLKAATPHTTRRTPVRILGGGIMLNLYTFVKSLSNREEGQDLLEYALLVALIALVAFGAVELAGGSVNDIFSAIAGSLSTAVPS